VVPFQACRVHFDRRLDSNIPKAKWSTKAPLYVELKARIRAVLFANTYEQARSLVDKLIAERKRFKDTGNVDVIHALRRSFDHYMAHHFTPGLPADNNVTENVIKQLNKKAQAHGGLREHRVRRALRPVAGGAAIASSASPTRAARPKMEGHHWSSRASPRRTRLALLPDRSMKGQGPLGSLAEGPAATLNWTPPRKASWQGKMELTQSDHRPQQEASLK
jgi:hypothetical protein